jgi:hypothetical protein
MHSRSSKGGAVPKVSLEINNFINNLIHLVYLYSRNSVTLSKAVFVFVEIRCSNRCVLAGAVRQLHLPQHGSRADDLQRRSVKARLK